MALKFPILVLYVNKLATIRSYSEPHRDYDLLSCDENTKQSQAFRLAAGAIPACWVWTLL